MADKEQHNGRMLFTDFDASDKGRPVAVLGAQALQEMLATNRPTLNDIAESLELRFEDDADDEPPPPREERADGDGDAAEPGTGGEKPKTAGAREGDEELALGDVEERPRRATDAYYAPPAADAPSWDALAGAYERARPVGEIVSQFMPAAPETAGAFSRENDDAMLDDQFAAAPFGPAQADEAVDVLSMLDEWLENEGLPGAMEKPFPLPRPVPYGGVERVEDWFAPPEDQPPDPFARIEGWYEPPARTGEEDDPGETKVDISWLSEFQNELPEGEYWRKQTRRLEKVDAGSEARARPDAAREKHPPTDTADLFSEMDIDGLWDQKVAAKQKSRPSPDNDTRQMSLFDNLDIDRLWREKQEGNRRRADQAGGAPDFSGQARGGGADQTVIVGADQLEADGTVILHDTVLPRAFDAGAGRGTKKSQGTARREQARPRAAEEGDGDVLSSLDSIAARQEESAARPPEANADADTDTVEMLAPPGSGGAAGEPDAVGEDGGFDADALVEEAAGMASDGNVIGGDSEYGEEREYVARTPDPVDSRKKRGLDDLLNDLDLDSLADEAGDVSAPVIDDSAIDEIAGPRPGTEEMEAIAAREGEAEEEKEPAAAAVNPMDVFANMDDMDFSDDMDDEMRAMMEEEEGAEEDGAEGEGAAEGRAESEVEAVPTTRLGKARYRAFKMARRVLPMKLVEKVATMIAWRENWWFYCDLVAAVVASGSLAVIISYLFWYRGA